MVNDLHRLGPGSVGGGGGGAGWRGTAQNGMNSKQTSTSEASLAVEWRLHGFPYGSQIFFRHHPPGHNLCGGETMQNNTSCAQTLLTLPVEKTISHLDPPESLTVLSTDAHIREFLLYYHTIKPHLDHVPVIPQAEAIPFSLTRLSRIYHRHKWWPEDQNRNDNLV